MARSGSASRTSRGVSSWSAAVSTPTCMNFGANAVVDIGLIITAVCVSFPAGQRERPVNIGLRSSSWRSAVALAKAERTGPTLIACASIVFLGSHAQGRGQASPASVPPPRSTTNADVSRRSDRGRTAAVHRAVRLLSRPRRDGRRVGSRPDACRVVAEDVRGDKLGPLIRAGRADKGMPAFHVERRRSRCNRRVRPRPEGQGGVA